MVRGMVAHKRPARRKESSASKASPYGPITRAAFGAAKDQSPPILREWSTQLTEPGDLFMGWAGVLQKRGETGKLQWVVLFDGIRAHRPADQAPGDASAVPYKVERMLAPLAHEARVRIMQALRHGPRSASELSEATTLRGGALYHHLKELLYASYVQDRKGTYALTDLGWQLLVTVRCIAECVVQDQGEQGLAVGPNWAAKPLEP